jgi:hypothetical protein
MSTVPAADEALNSAHLPEWVDRVNAEAMVDHTGEPALRVTVVVRNEREDVLEDGRALAAFSRGLLEALQAAGVELFPYTRFVTVAEAT